MGCAVLVVCPELWEQSGDLTSLPSLGERRNKRWPWRNRLEASADIAGVGGEEPGAGEGQGRRGTKGPENIGFYSEMRCQQRLR